MFLVRFVFMICFFSHHISYYSKIRGNLTCGLFLYTYNTLTVRQAVNHVIAKMYFKFALQFMIDMVASLLLLVNRLLQTLPHVYHTVITTCGKILKCMWGRIGSTPSITAMTLKQRNTCITKNDTAIVK